jgi:flagellar hook assembly protein FlgD
MSHDDFFKDFELYQNYPNPFNAKTQIMYSIFDNEIESLVSLKIFDVMGNLVKVLMNEQKSAGDYRICWDGTDSHGHSVSSGIYHCVIQIGQRTQVQKLLFLK